MDYKKQVFYKMRLSEKCIISECTLAATLNDGVL